MFSFSPIFLIIKIIYRLSIHVHNIRNYISSFLLPSLSSSFHIDFLIILTVFTFLFFAHYFPSIYLSQKYSRHHEAKKSFNIFFLIDPEPILTTSFPLCFFRLKLFPMSYRLLYCSRDSYSTFFLRFLADCGSDCSSLKFTIISSSSIYIHPPMSYLS